MQPEPARMMSRRSALKALQRLRCRAPGGRLATQPIGPSSERRARRSVGLDCFAGPERNRFPLPARADAFAGRFDWRFARQRAGRSGPRIVPGPFRVVHPAHAAPLRFLGAGAAFYPPLANLAQHSVEWQRERVVATAARFLGYDYQYHHIPDWNPPPTWPWKPTSAGHNGKGVDCSNLTSFVFNQGFGIRISSGIHRQADSSTALEARLGPVAIRTIELPKRYRRPPRNSPHRRLALHPGARRWTDLARGDLGRLGRPLRQRGAADH